jgi:hypothetical protein
MSDPIIRVENLSEKYIKSLFPKLVQVIGKR